MMQYDLSPFSKDNYRNLIPDHRFDKPFNQTKYDNYFYITICCCGHHLFILAMVFK